MTGIEKDLCNATIDAVLAAYYTLSDASVNEALRKVARRYGKGDTLGLDAMPEITIENRLHQYDPSAIFITEETAPKEKLSIKLYNDPRQFKTVFISDPTDRTEQFAQFLELFKGTKKTVGEAVRSAESKTRWEADYGTPATITGSSSAVSCVYHGKPIFSVTVNYITEQLVVACSRGIHYMHLPQAATTFTLDTLMSKGLGLCFRTIDRSDPVAVRRFVTFLGKEGYFNNLKDSGLMETEAELKAAIHYDLPGGPLRILYLSPLQQKEKPIGFVLANGEKVGEWVHWLPFIRFGRSREDQGTPTLRLFEIFQEQPHTKDKGVLMSTPPAYSIFRDYGGESGMVIDVNRFPSYENPSRIRSTLIVTPSNNDWATRVVNEYGYREIKFD